MRYMGVNGMNGRGAACVVQEMVDKAPEGLGFERSGGFILRDRGGI